MHTSWRVCKARGLGIFAGGGPLFTALLFAAARSIGAAPSAPDLAQEAHSLKAVCAKCHNLELVTNVPMSYDAWRDTVQAMVDRGARGTDDQFDDIMDYLHRTTTTIDVNTADAEELEIVLGVSDATAQAIIARRTVRRFTNVTDLKTVPGLDAAVIDTKARLIFFQ